MFTSLRQPTGGSYESDEGRRKRSYERTNQVNNKADHNSNAAASAVALTPTGSNAGSDNPNPIDQAIAELAGLNDSAERAVTAFPVVAAVDRGRFRLQGFSDADFERELGQVVALRQGNSTGGINTTELETLRGRRLAVAREGTRLRPSSAGWKMRRLK